MRRPAPPRDMPPPLELECLKALWSIGEGTVHDVQRVIANKRKLAYTTVMTVMDRLEKRGAVSRRKQGRSFVYLPKLRREELQRSAVKEMVERFFEGSEDALSRFLQKSRTEQMDASLL
jgi:BlaI family transcriptional regulator, penicillinase repressor